jgi:hypothetical protein
LWSSRFFLRPQTLSLSSPCDPCPEPPSHSQMIFSEVCLSSLCGRPRPLHYRRQLTRPSCCGPSCRVRTSRRATATSLPFASQSLQLELKLQVFVSGHRAEGRGKGRWRGGVYLRHKYLPVVGAGCVHDFEVWQAVEGHQLVCDREHPRYQGLQLNPIKRLIARIAPLMFGHRNGGFTFGL